MVVLLSKTGLELIGWEVVPCRGKPWGQYWQLLFCFRCESRHHNFITYCLFPSYFWHFLVEILDSCVMNDLCHGFLNPNSVYFFSSAYFGLIAHLFSVSQGVFISSNVWATDIFVPDQSSPLCCFVSEHCPPSFPFWAFCEHQTPCLYPEARWTVIWREVRRQVIRGRWILFPVSSEAWKITLAWLPASLVPGLKALNLIF